MQPILKIAISLNVALYVEAGFCQIQSHLIYAMYSISTQCMLQKRVQSCAKRLESCEIERYQYGTMNF